MQQLLHLVKVQNLAVRLLTQVQNLAVQLHIPAELNLAVLLQALLAQAASQAAAAATAVNKAFKILYIKFHIHPAFPKTGFYFILLV